MRTTKPMTFSTARKEVIGVGRPGPWLKRAVCPCGWNTYAPFGDLFQVPYEVCPECGTSKEHKGLWYNWRVKTMRWVSTSVWWRPSTWGTGYWEERGATDAEGEAE